jgi:Tfp pilus assembly protein PilO
MGSLTKKIIFIGFVVLIGSLVLVRYFSSNQEYSDAMLISLVWVLVILLIVAIAYFDEFNSELKEIERSHLEELQLMKAEINLTRCDMNELHSLKAKKK